MEQTNCPICGADDNEVIFVKKESAGESTINVICKKCSLVFINPRGSKQEYDFFHEENFLSGKNLTKMEQVIPKLTASNLAIKKTILVFLNEFILPGQNILDVGCGFGTLLDIMKKEKSVNAFGIELGNLDVKVAKEYYDLDVFHGSLEEFSKLPENTGKFDIVIMHHVLEHLPEPLISLSQIKIILRAGGILYIGVPNVFDMRKKPEDFFYNFHPLSLSPYSLKKLLEKAGFGIIRFNPAAGLPGGMEIVAKIGAENINDEKLSTGDDYRDVINYVSTKESQFNRLRGARDGFLCFLPKNVRIKIGRIVYRLMKKYKRV